jgi:hypothetical protein
MTEEYQSIMKNEVWEIVPRPKNKYVVSFRWLFKIKHAADGSIEKYKARFFARGFSQKEGIDYEETFTPVARYTSIRTIITLAAKMKWKLHQMDVKTTLLNGVIGEEVYIEKLQGFEVEDMRSHVCRLKKALYGSKLLELGMCNVPTLGHHHRAETYDDQSSQMDVIVSTRVFERHCGVQLAFIIIFHHYEPFLTGWIWFHSIPTISMILTILSYKLIKITKKGILGTLLGGTS